MEEFKIKLQKKIWVYYLFSGICAVGVLLLTIFGKANDGFNATSGLLGELFAISFCNIIKIRKALKNDEMLKQIYIKNTDERNIQIAKEAANASFHAIIIGIALATVIANFISVTVSCTLSVCLAFIFMVNGALSAYYNKKM
ncbi:MAG: hypothetical protein K6G33_07350 [Ruminococcus sp.]|uniref:hypothetical protein n=1 Tax=Ruminococcus sp. TaxID=41978 RepID=UPI0025FC70AC|nr:hypothetical protein [Ruminococcus sp.]MCR5600538.1 hypothetical protein [Ruminococcus sp.]